MSDPLHTDIMDIMETDNWTQVNDTDYDLYQSGDGQVTEDQDQVSTELPEACH